MDQSNSLMKFSNWSIKWKIIATCGLFLCLIAGGNLYSYLGNQRVIAQQERLVGDRLKKLLLYETISSHIALAELESRSFILFEKEEFLSLRRGIWESAINPAIGELETVLSRQGTEPDPAVKQLLQNLTTYRTLQERTEKDARELFIHAADTVQIEIAKQQFANRVNETQRPVFDAIKKGTAQLSSGERNAIQSESEALTELMKTQQGTLLLLVLLSILLAVALSYVLIRSSIRPLKQLSEYLHWVSLGKLPDAMAASHDEVGQMVGAINILVSNQKAMAQFAQQIGEGKYDNHFTPASQEDTLGNALVVMQNKLYEIEQEDRQRSWATEGAAQFSELLRDQSIDRKTLGDQLVAFLVRYLKANQGGLFILQGEGSERCLELVACYAYDRKKYLQKTIRWGEGLVGQAVQEGDTIYLTEVPADYVHITSGLGGANPTSIVIVPLKINEQVYGVIELASFQTFAPFEIELLEKLAETAASAISTSQMHEQTRQLLEELQQQTEEMRAQEEEMRQNLEELQATQEGMQRILRESQEQEQYMYDLINATDNMVFTLSPQYEFVYFNEATRAYFLSYGVQITKHFNALDLFTPDQRPIFREYYDRALAGETFGRIDTYSIGGEEYFFSARYSPIRDREQAMIGIAIFCTNVTETLQAKQTADQLLIESQEKALVMQAQEEFMRQHLQQMTAAQQEMERVLHEAQRKEAYLQNLVNATNDAILTIDTGYRIGYCNRGTVEMFAPNGIHVQSGMSIFDLFEPAKHAQYKAQYDRVLAGEPLEVNKEIFGATYHSKYHPIRSEDGTVIGISIFSQNITRKSELEL